MKFINLITKEFNYLIFLKKRFLIRISDKKIKRLVCKIEVEKQYNYQLSKDTLELINKIQKLEN